MKRKRFDHRAWVRVESAEQTVHPLPAGVLGGGVLVDYRAGRVIQPLDRPFGSRTLRLLDSGFRWVYVQPHEPLHALTVMLDSAGQPVQLYVDTAAGGGLDADGLPYIHDLYLDVLAVCDPHTWAVQELHLKDAGELEDALRGGQLCAEQAAQATAEAERVSRDLWAGTFAPLQVVREYLLHAP